MRDGRVPQLQLLQPLLQELELGVSLVQTLLPHAVSGFLPPMPPLSLVYLLLRGLAAPHVSPSLVHGMLAGWDGLRESELGDVSLLLFLALPSSGDVSSEQRDRRSCREALLLPFELCKEILDALDLGGEDL
jgi:hypothetical protein